MDAKGVILAILNLIVILGLVIFIIAPGSEIDFNFSNSNNHNFTISNSTIKNVQFYDNMRFAEKNISYWINESCNIKKRSRMKEAFEEIENLTVLSFYEDSNGAEIEVYCDKRSIIENGLFIAGEGGPTNITKTSNYNVITRGEILLIRDSGCYNPNIEIHELLHVLGFDHSENKNNIMYPISKCSQSIGEDLIRMINELYSEGGFSDLSFEDADARIVNRYLDLNFSVRNNGLSGSGESKVIVYVDNKKIKEVDIAPLGVGHGLKIKISDIWVSKIKINEIVLEIESDFEELNKKNNKIILSKS